VAAFTASTSLSQPRSTPGSAHWSLASLKEKLIKIGAKVISHGRGFAFQVAEVAFPDNDSRRFCG
jgi:hypothetical protein